jgi:hypothetical protein
MVHDRQLTALQAAHDAVILLTAILARFAFEVQSTGGTNDVSNALAVGAYGVALFFRQRYLVFGALQIVKESIADMTPEEENAQSYRRDRHYRRVSDFIDDNEAKNLTNYKKSELLRLLLYSELEEWIFVPIHGRRSTRTWSKA